MGIKDAKAKPPPPREKIKRVKKLQTLKLKILSFRERLRELKEALTLKTNEHERTEGRAKRSFSPSRNGMV